MNNDREQELLAYMKARDTRRVRIVQWLAVAAVIVGTVSTVLVLQTRHDDKRDREVNEYVCALSRDC